MLNRTVFCVAAMLLLPCMSMAWGQGCDNPATAVGANGSFTIELKGGAPTYDGDLVTFTYEVCQVGGKNGLSHWIFVPDIDCYGVDENGTPYTLADVVDSATLQTLNSDTASWDNTHDIVVGIGLDPTTGLNGIKSDDLDPTDDCHRYTFTFDVSKLAPGYTLCAGCISAATKAGNEDVRGRGRNAALPASTTILGPVCCLIAQCVEETAYGGNSAGGGRAWWFYFDNAGPETQTITAGQFNEIGTVSIENNGDGTSTITITLDPGSDLQNVSEPVKIQGYDTLPSSRPPSGLFTTYKGGDLVVTVPSSRYYVIHLDAKLCD